MKASSESWGVRQRDSFVSRFQSPFCSFFSFDLREFGLGDTKIVALNAVINGVAFDGFETCFFD
jgi:hypothetical protein